MRQEYDDKADIMRSIISDEPIAGSHEYMDGPVRNIIHVDANGRMVQMEIHGFSKMQERAAQTQRRHFKAEAGLAQIVGEVDWAITETATGATLAEGHKVVRLEEIGIQLIQAPGKTVASKLFPLTDQFVFGIATGLMPEVDVRGFALIADRTDVQTFCWEWFNIDGANHATKLQEGGELAIEVANPNSQWQIVRTEFLSDISIRVERFGELHAVASPAWRVLIRKGSWVSWPSIVDGVVSI